MVKKKFNDYRHGLAGFIRSEKGQRFFNFAYSLGAAVVIWGALFKILHLPGGNTLLSIGMGTEVLMFVLTAFDRPPREYKWESVFPALAQGEASDEDEDTDETQFEGETTQHKGQTGIPSANRNGGGVLVIGAGNSNTTNQPVTPNSPSGVSATAAGTVTEEYAGQLAALTSEMAHLRETTAALNNVGDVLLESYRAITENSENITRSSTGYVEQMQALNRNILGLNTIYEIQLRSISGQLESIDRVNQGIKDIRDMYEKSSNQSARYAEETEKMARYMQQLNAVYARMISAMSVNMYAAPSAGQAPVVPPAPDTKPEA